MISQRCPKCNSSRVRAGYRPTPFWSKMLFRYNLLCNNCNWEFRGFAVPGTVTAKSKKSKRKQTEIAAANENDDLESNQTPKNAISHSVPVKIKKRVKIRL